MARLERLKYLPMLVRAYQEARTRTLGQPSDSSDMRSQPGGSTTAQLRSAEASAEAKQPVRQRTGSNAERRAKKRVTNRTSQRFIAASNARSGRPGGQLPPRRRSRGSNAHAAMVSKSASRTNKLGTTPSIQHLFNELRATKQQLSQLRAIQTQLNKVQVQLDQQLQVLRESVHGASQKSTQKPTTDSKESTSAEQSAEERRTESSAKNRPMPHQSLAQPGGTVVTRE